MAPPFDYHIPSRALLQVQQSFIASSTALVMPFRPRNRRERMEAIGLLPDGKLNHMEYYELEQRKDKNFLRILSMLLRPDLQSFQLLGIPNADDWLATRKESGQTFEAYAKKWGHRRPRRKGYAPRKIYLLPLVGAKGLEGFPDPKALLSIVAAFFCLPTIMLDPVRMKDLPKDGKAIGTCHESEEGQSWKQYNASNIMRCLERRKPSDAHALMAFTMHDLYVPGYNFLFGRASTSGVGVFSFFRQDPASVASEFWNGTNEREEGDEEVLLRHASMVLCHEIGHILGLRHCLFFSCLMQGSNSMEEAEGRGACRLCPCCLRKLSWAVGVSPQTHYEKLLEHCAAWPGTYADDLEWIAMRLSLLQQAKAPNEEMPTGLCLLPLLPNTAMSTLPCPATGTESVDASLPIQEASDAVGDLVEVAEQMAIDGAVVLSHKGVIVRKTASKRSGVVTRAAEGEEIEIPQPIKLERTESGTTRLQIDQGWATLETKQGNRLLGTRKKYLVRQCSGGLDENEKWEGGALDEKGEEGLRNLAEDEAPDAAAAVEVETAAVVEECETLVATLQGKKAGGSGLRAAKLIKSERPPIIPDDNSGEGTENSKGGGGE